MQSLKTILYATDLSELAGDAFHAAFALARDHHACLIMLYVKQPQETIQGEFGLMPPEPELSDPEILAKLGEQIPVDAAVRVERLVVHGRAVDVIVEVAREKRSEVIVMGTHGRTGLGRLFDGNLADRITRAAPCPVLALRSGPADAKVIGDERNPIPHLEPEPTSAAEGPSDSQHDLVRLASSTNPVLAHILQQSLADDGIRCQVLGDYLEAGIGNIPGMSAEVWVEPDDFSRAEAILREHQNEREEVTQREENF